MAYAGTTAASTASNPPRLLIPRVGGVPGSSRLSTASGGGMDPWRMQTGAVWLYASSHPTATVAATGFFTDGEKLGMRPGDLMFTVKWTTAGSSVTVALGVIQRISTAGAASLSTSVQITST
jgi:hypothetical protein